MPAILRRGQIRSTSNCRRSFAGNRNRRTTADRAIGEASDRSDTGGCCHQGPGKSRDRGIQRVFGGCKSANNQHRPSGGNYGTLQNLVEAGLLDETFLKVKNDYSFTILALDSDYVATAVPTADGGRFGYYSVADAVVRYSLAEELSPPREGGQAVQ